MRKRILLIEPYYGGSHRQFIDGLTGNIPADFTLMTLPARKWKMRMQLAAPWFISQVEGMSPGDRWFHAVLFSTFIDVAVFKALVQKIEGWNENCSYLTYFHENQFEYPSIQPKQTLHQFTAINFTTALVSDGIAFNSWYNKNSFLNHCRSFVEKDKDTKIGHVLEIIDKKSIVLYPGIDFSDLDRFQKTEKSSTDPLIVWNHRWEHDKNPEEFFKVLFDLKERGQYFRLAVLGQRFRDRPECFNTARERLEDRIIQFGFLEERQDYSRILAKGDVIVSTAHHEFFGIAVIEAVRSGCIPVLPQRLSYPELFDNQYLYPDNCLADHLERVLIERPFLSIEQRELMTGKFAWQALVDQYKNWLRL
jgi:glycosyltransferase involved in cell wall biosynthesis